MATKKPTEQLLTVPQDGQTYVRNTDGSLTPFHQYSNQGGSYMRNKDGTLTKITDQELTATQELNEHDF